MKLAQSEWASSNVLDPKQDGILQFCVDYWHSKAATIPEIYQPANMNVCNDNLGEAKKPTSLESLCRYWSVPIRNVDTDMTIFYNSSSHLPLQCRLAYEMRLPRSNVRRILSFLNFGGKPVLFIKVSLSFFKK